MGNLHGMLWKLVGLMDMMIVDSLIDMSGQGQKMKLRIEEQTARNEPQCEFKNLNSALWIFYNFQECNSNGRVSPRCQIHGFQIVT